jgi:hypothetical protein
MPRKVSKPAAPKLEASAKASAKLKAEYSRKRTITVVEPPDVTRAKSRTLLTLLSPLVEFAGRKGEEQRHKRRLQRLQYQLEEAALKEIIFRARQRLSRDVAVIKPVPMKFIVPFLEQASLEDPDSILVDLWANLLAFS